MDKTIEQRIEALEKLQNATGEQIARLKMIQAQKKASESLRTDERRK